MRNERTIEVLGIRMYNNDLDSFGNHVIQTLLNEEPIMNRCISATGAHGIIYSKKNLRFKELLNGFYMNLPDGMPVVWVGRLKGAKLMRRCYGPDFFEKVMKDSVNYSVKHFLCGGDEGVAEQLKKICSEKFGNTNIVGTFCPPFKKVDEYDYPGIAEKINSSGADVVWLGISTPKQEQFAQRLSQYTNVHFLVTIGAAFDFHIGNVKQAPTWMQKIGLEWFFRLYTEPRRLHKRYLDIVPKFLFYSVIDVFLFYFRSAFTGKERS